MKTLKGLSLFANVGVAEARLSEIGVEISVANELVEDRARFYSHAYPRTKMIAGDITSTAIFQKIISASKSRRVNFLMATPPCQGMSTAGKQDPTDTRNQLTIPAVKAIKILLPQYALLENVPQQLKTTIRVDDSELPIPEYIHRQLSRDYKIRTAVIQVSEYGVPQIRQRSVFLLTRSDQKKDFDFLDPSQLTQPQSLAQAIGHLPSLDPRIQGFTMEQQLSFFPDYHNKERVGLQISKWHRPPIHKVRHVEVMRYTPEGMSALRNERHYPRNPDGTRIKGYPNTYKRQWWNRPAYTITTYNGAICSHDNVHPGRPAGKDKHGNTLYSDPRVLSIYELMIAMSLPTTWNIPDWARESLIRHSLGEGIPPFVLNKLLSKLLHRIRN